MNIIGITGSLRKDSFNTKLLEELAKTFPEGTQFTLLKSDLPLYNEDVEAADLPESVVKMREAIAAADGVVISSPEYNYSVSGVLKNTLDWLSRPAYNSCFKHKPVAILSASMAIIGGARAQEALRPVLAAMLSEIYPAPTFILPSVHTAFNEQGALHDEKTMENLGDFAQGFVDWIKA